MAIRPTDIQQIGDNVAIKWSDGSESIVSFESLRRHCPCAGCKGERDIMGALHKGPDIPLTPKSFQLVRMATVGGYGLQPFWADGHSTGIYPFGYVKKIAEEGQ